MREILFRGKTPNQDEHFDDGEWVQGFYTCFNKKEHRIYNGYAETDCGDYYPDWYNVRPETVGQYTNKNDMNCTKIFEYDIVKEGCNGLIGVVVYDNDLATYKLEGFGEGYTIQDAEIEWEVIGNKFDNPELLRTPQNDEVREWKMK